VGDLEKLLKNDLVINELDRNKLYDESLWLRLIYVVNPTLWDKTWLLLWKQ